MSKAAKKKEEERIEKIIRNLLKLPENRRCINCTSLGPQYVCTTFWTFVCTNCSGLHREFTHRVKSVSMAKFSAEEVSALQAGGNERAREIYFKVWDPQRHTLPDGSNQNRLRDFIRQVYVDRKYTGERTAKVAVTKTVDAMEDSSGRRSIDNPSFGGWTESGSKYHIDERRSPQYKQDTGKSRNRPTRFEIVDDRFRDDDFCCWRRSDTQRVYNAESRSPVAPKTREKTSPPAVRSFKDILSEDIQPPQEEKCPEDNNDAKNNKKTDPQEEKPVSSSAKGSVDAKPLEVTREKSFSLIDLMADPEPSDLAAAPQTQETSSSIVGANEGLVKSPGNASNAPQVNSLELMLFELSDPPSGQLPGDIDIPNAASVAGEVHEASPGGTESILPCSSSDHMVAGNDGSHLTSSDDISSTTQQLFPSAGTSSDQAWSSSPALNPRSASVIEPSQPGPNVAQDITSQTGPRDSSTGAKSRGRGELPVDLFTGSYPSFQAPVQNWQFHLPHGMGFNMYPYPPNSVPGPSFSNLARSRNPFNLGDTVIQAQTPVIQYPSMLPVQDAALNLPAHHVLLNASHMNSSQFMQSQASPYQAMPPTQIPTYEISPVPGAFSGQRLPYGMPLSGSQGDNSVGTGQQKDPFAALSPIQQHTEGGQTVPFTENFFPSTGGNPFG